MANTTPTPATEYDLYRAMMICERRAAVEASRGKHDVAKFFRLRAEELKFQAWNSFEAVREMERWHG